MDDFRALSRSLVAMAVVLGAVSVGTACSSASKAVQVRVTATQEDCVLSDEPVESGAIVVEFVNDTDIAADLFLLTPTDGVIAKAQAVAAGATGKANAALIPGDYVVACIPGGAGRGNRATLRVR